MNEDSLLERVTAAAEERQLSQNTLTAYRRTGRLSPRSLDSKSAVTSFLLTSADHLLTAFKVDFGYLIVRTLDAA